MTDDQPRPNGEADREPARTDAEFDSQSKGIAVNVERAQLQRLRDELATELVNRKLRGRVANGALIVMLVQIVAANGIFVWYGDTNGWAISARP